MKKIMFNDKYGLTQAVLEGRKTITRRAVPMHDYKYGFQVYYDRETKQCCVCDGSFIVERSRYARGEVVAIAQSYRDIYLNSGSIYKIGLLGRTSVWRNKMYVFADDMPHHIKITNIRIERLQDISDEDCLREGIYFDREGGSELGYPISIPFYYTFRGAVNNNSKQLYWTFPRDAFATLIDKVSGKGTWDSNPLVWVYEFELINSKE